MSRNVKKFKYIQIFAMHCFVFPDLPLKNKGDRTQGSLLTEQEQRKAVPVPFIQEW